MNLSDDLLRGMPKISHYLGVTERAGYHMADKGQIPVFRIGATICARKSELDTALRSSAA
ncbi:MAG TPA: DNA-binding protein [Sphingomicrobium sp.]|nr:DNA-binding protein [Sphingomicrobium sp.]